MACTFNPSVIFQVATLHEDDYVRLKKSIKGSETNLTFSKSSTQKVKYMTKFS